MSNVTDVQLMIGDPSAALFTDAQVQSFLNMTASGGVESIFAAAAAACRSLSTSAVLLHKAEKIGNYSLDRKSMSAAYLSLAAEYEKRDQEIPAVGVFEQSWTPQNAVDIVFRDALRSL